MACTCLHTLPIVLFFWFPLSFILTFILAVALGHIHPLFPYISDTGTYSPESCLFGQLITMGLVLLSSILYVRYRQIREFCEFFSYNISPRVQNYNFMSIIFGILTILGVSIVGNFQETNIMSIHLFGAFLGFGTGLIYMILQTVISYKIFPLGCKLWILYLRVVLCSVSLLALVLCLLFAGISLRYFQGETVDAMVKWSKKDGGWELHLVSTVSEWVMITAYMTYFLTYSPEFRILSISEPVFHMDVPIITASDRT